MKLEVAYQSYRPLLMSIAYRMLGSVSDAEDLVQDAFVAARHLAENEASGDGDVRNVKAYLCKIVTNRCIDFLSSARKRRELYVGPWLPEPLVQPVGPAAGQDPLQTVVLEDTVSYAFMVMLERLTPVERAVFILREAFEYDYRDIAEMIGKTELGCRQIFSRLKRKLQAEPAAIESVHNEASGRAGQLVQLFLQAAETGDIAALTAMLTEDIIVYTDGGGKAKAAVNPIFTPARAAAFLVGLAKQIDETTRIRSVLVNGKPGLAISGVSDPYPFVISFQLSGDHIQRIYLVRNPDKLRHLQWG